MCIRFHEENIRKERFQNRLYERRIFEVITICVNLLYSAKLVPTTPLLLLNKASDAN